MIVPWTVLLPPIGGWKNGNRAMEFEKPVLPAKQMMSLFSLFNLGLKDLFVKGYKLEDIWNMDELGLFFKLLPDKRLIEKK